MFAASLANGLETFRPTSFSSSANPSKTSPPTVDYIRAFSESTQPVNLQFSSSEHTTYLGSSERFTGGDRTVIVETEKTGLFGQRNSSVSTSVAQKVTDFHWETSVSFSLSIYSGNNVDDCVALSTTNIGSSENKVFTLLEVESVKRAYSTATINNPRRHKGPHSNAASNEAIRVNRNPIVTANVTYLFKSMHHSTATNNRTSVFTIDRSDSETCITPRNNPAVSDFVDFVRSLKENFLDKVLCYARTDLMAICRFLDYRDGWIVLNGRRGRKGP